MIYEFVPSFEQGICVNRLCGFMNPEFISHLTGNTIRLRYKIKRIMLFRGKILFIVRTTRNTQMQCVGRTQSFSIPKQVIDIEPLGFKDFVDVVQI
jgi:hypothetical protein